MEKRKKWRNIRPVLQPAAKKVHLKLICGFSRPLQLTHGLYLTFRGTFLLDGPEGASAMWRVVAAEQWERFEVIGDKASVDAGGDGSLITEATLMLFSAGRLEEWETACHLWASLTVKLEEWGVIIALLARLQIQNIHISDDAGAGCVFLRILST